MIQKTYHLSRCTPDKLAAVTAEIAELPAYQNASQVLLLVLEQCWNTGTIRQKNRWIRQALKKAEIVGVTHFDGLVTGEKIPENTILTLFFFEAPAFRICRIPMTGESEEAVGRTLGRAMAEQAYLRCVLTVFSCLPKDIGLVLETAEQGNPDVPFFGATAGVGSFFEHGAGVSCIFDADGVYQDALLAVLFCGKQLHVKAAYNYGWTPVGKTLTITKLRDPYTVGQIDGRPAADVYEKYLGIPWRTNSLSLNNICEFPLTTERHGLRMARIPYAWDAGGNLHFAITMHEGEKLRLTYGLPQQIFAQIHGNRDEFLSFRPEAVTGVNCSAARRRTSFPTA